jgi:transposase-like protein
MKGTRRKLTLEFREEAVRQVLQERVTVLEAAKRLEISDKTLANWVRAARQGKMPRVSCLEQQDHRRAGKNAALNRASFQ